MQDGKNKAGEHAGERNRHGAAQARINEPAEYDFLCNGSKNHRGKRRDKSWRIQARRSFRIGIHERFRDGEQRKQK